MQSNIKGAVLNGYTASLIEVECSLSNSLPNITIVGMGSKSVDEAKERVRSAVTNSKLTIPRKRVVINLAPAELPKSGTSLDLSIAVAILAASTQLRPGSTQNTIFVGELSLDGSIRPITGVLAYVALAKELKKRLVLPTANYQQASLIKNVELVAVKDLPQLIRVLNDQEKLAPPPVATPKPVVQDPLLDKVVGQEYAKQALIIAVAGRHNLLFSGPPGTGKTMLAQSATSLMPPLDPHEVEQLTHIYSLITNKPDIISVRPFRSPHHTASHISLVGGGRIPKPGELSLAHHGVLFLDELLEFSRHTLETLRQPLENKVVNITRTEASAEFPANIMAIGALNPCPCGYFGSNQTACSCSSQSIAKYQQKLSGPLLDRFDISVYVERLKLNNMSRLGKTTYKDTVVKIKTVWKLQKDRNKSLFNSELGVEQLIKMLDSKDTLSSVNNAADTLNLSMRSYVRVLRVARTIADLDSKTKIEMGHIYQALAYRPSINSNSGS